MKSGARRLPVIVAALAMTWLLAAPSHAREPRSLPSGSVYALRSTWTRQDGRRIRLSSLAGRPEVLALIYTSCRYTCPLTVAALRRIERTLPERWRGRVGFVLVSIDPARDTPAALARYAREHGLDARHYTLLHGDDDSVRELAAVLGFHYRKVAGGNYAHDSLLTLLDDQGVILASSSDLSDPGPILRALK